jgi:hypothetical protein
LFFCDMILSVFSNIDCEKAVCVELKSVFE